MKKMSCLLGLFLCLTSFSCSNDKGNDVPGTSKPSEKINIVTITPFTESIHVKLPKANSTTKYMVRYATTADMSEAETMKADSNVFEIKNLHNKTTYYLQARASISSQWTPWSDIKKVKTAVFSATVETFNILGDSAYFHNHGDTSGLDSWNYRRLAFKDLILAPDNSPDILVLQEAEKKSQLEDIVSLLKNSYNVHINSRVIDPRAIFWKKNKYSLVDFDDNIEGYDSSVPERYYTGRYISYVRLREKTTGKELLIFDIHPNSGSSAERQRMRGMLVKKVTDTAKVLSEKYHAPAIVLGDFNNYSNTVIDGLPSGPMVARVAGFTDTFDEAVHKTNAEYQTYDEISKTEPSKSPRGSRRLDYIFTYPKDMVTVSDYRNIIRFKKGSTTFSTPRPSDHHPVCSTLHFFY